MLGWDDEEGLLAAVLAESQKEYLDSLKRNMKEHDSNKGASPKNWYSATKLCLQSFCKTKHGLSWPVKLIEILLRDPKFGSANRITGLRVSELFLSACRRAISGGSPRYDFNNEIGSADWRLSLRYNLKIVQRSFNEPKLAPSALMNSRSTNVSARVSSWCAC